MSFPRTRIWKDLLFLDGHVADPQLAVALAAEPAPPFPSPRHRSTNRSTDMNFFKSLMYLGGLEDIDLRIHEDGTPYGPTYGNRVASEQVFGKRPAELPARGNPNLAALEHCALGGCG